MRTLMQPKIEALTRGQIDEILVKIVAIAEKSQDNIRFAQNIAEFLFQNGLITREQREILLATQ